MELPTTIAGVVDRSLLALETDRRGEHRLRREPHQEHRSEKEEYFFHKLKYDLVNIFSALSANIMIFSQFSQKI